MKTLSQITERFTESVIREMTRVCDAAGGVNLAQGFPDFEAPAEVKAAAVAAIEADHNQYPVTFGEAHLRQAVSEKMAWYNGLEPDPETEITVCCGATEAMIATLKAIINPGDEVIVFEPFYENYGPDAILSGAKPVFVTLRTPDWSFDYDQLAQAFNEKTKAIIINTPNNPTGKVFTLEELEFIAAQCRQWDCLAVTDEIYEHILYDDAEHISLASLPGMTERTITINSISKTYSVTGWRVGWAVAQTEITARIRKVHDFLTVGAPRPFQDAAAFALGLPREYYTGLAQSYRDKRSFVLEALTRAGFQPAEPKGAYYTLVQAEGIMDRLGAADDTDLAMKLIEKIGLASVPGSSFYSDPLKGSTQVRFSFCKKWETLKAVAERLSRL